MLSHSLHQKIEAAVSKKQLLGMSLCILKNGEFFSDGYGDTGFDQQRIPVSTETIFPYSSISKTICAVTVLRLVDRHLLELDVPVEEYLDGFAFDDRINGIKVTLRHLLSHSSGLPASGKDYGPQDDGALRRYVYDEILHHRFLATPGTFHIYSNTAICLAGYVAEEVSGIGYDRLVQQEVFDVLKMTHSSYDTAMAATKPLAISYHKDHNGRMVPLSRLPDNHAGHPSSFCFGTAEDLGKLAAMLLNGGVYEGEVVLEEDSVTAMFTPNVSRFNATANHPWSQIYTGHGLGLMTGRYRGVKAVRHGGMTHSYNSRFDLFPEQQVALIYHTNYSAGAALDDITYTLYEELLEINNSIPRYSVPPPPQKFTGNLDNYVGQYVNIAQGSLIEIQKSNGELILAKQGEHFPLIYSGKNHFHYCQQFEGFAEEIVISVEWVKDENGQFHLMHGGLPAHPIEVDPDDFPDIEQLQSWVGRYKDPENRDPDDVFMIAFDDGKLTAKRNGINAQLQPIGCSSFVGGPGVIEFQEMDGTLDEPAKLVLVNGGAACYYPLLD